jgi:hypothetical protein
VLCGEWQVVQFGLAALINVPVAPFQPRCSLFLKSSNTSMWQPGAATPSVVFPAQKLNLE